MKGIFVKATLLGTLFVFLKCTIICSAENNARLETDVTKSTQQAEGCDCKGGTCEKEDGKLVCKCPPEYGLYPTTTTSSYCEKCDCGKGANCTFEYGSWFNTKKCICKEGYKFFVITCIGNCIPNPCKNGGSCSVKNFEIVCSCMGQFKGELCEISPCESYSCNNREKCNVKDGIPTCQCRKPYSGPKCEKDLCTENPCKNGGICQMEGTQMKCYCKSPFTGEFCDNDSCAINFCRNGGTCSVRNTTFYCNCDAPFYGEFCEKDPCSENPCNNGGSCFTRRNTFICDCKNPYVGSTCELDSTSCPKLIIIAVLATSVVFLIAYSICLSVRQFRRY